MTLSDVKIRNLKPKSKAYKVSDFDGLDIAITPRGSKLWRFKYRLDGKDKLLSIGAYPAISLAQARTIRDAGRATVAAGNDPSEVKQEQRRIRRETQGQTFEKVGTAVLDKQRKEGEAALLYQKLNII